MTPKMAEEPRLDLDDAVPSLGSSPSYDRSGSGNGGADADGNAPALAPASCDSSEAPSSPKDGEDSVSSAAPSDVDDRAGDGAGAAEGESKNETSAPPPQSIRTPDDDDDDDEDPYADARARMEELARRDRSFHALGEETLAGEGTEGADGVEAEGEDAPDRAHPRPCDPHKDITLFAAVTTYLGYVVLIATGHFRDLCATAFRRGRYFRSSRRRRKEGGDR